MHKISTYQMNRFPFLKIGIILLLSLAIYLPQVSAAPNKDEGKNNPSVPVLDSQNTANLPKNFRTTSVSLVSAKVPLPEATGLARLNASGSGEFTEKSLQTIARKLPGKKLIVVDLREESHLFVNGMPVTWYADYDWANLGKSRNAVEKDEIKKQESLLKEKFTTLYKVTKKGSHGEIGTTNAYPLRVNTVKTEKAVVKDAGYEYFRIACPDHRRPQDTEVDRFVRFVRELDPSTWLHFHCRAGLGRTTTFMAMYDMMRNSQQVSFKDILIRQNQIGGANLFKVNNSDPVKAYYAQQRLDFLKKFYEYCRTNKDGFKTSWTQWNKELPRP
jgi:hypothetical protein